MFQSYSLVAGGENFRGSRSERTRLWYMHKLKGFDGKYGDYACVGCGRCIETCPVDINVKTVWEYIHGQGANTIFAKGKKGNKASVKGGGSK